MNLMITGQHVEITPALRAYVENKFERIMRHFDHIIDAAVVLCVESLSDKDRRQRAEVNLRLKGNVLHVDNHAQDMYAAIDGLVDKLDRQLLKHKDKLQAHQNEPLKYVSSDVLSGDSLTP